ncbi:MAG TPA: DUF6146 family protein [Flavobacteriaceae bacterium]|nr:DUF6146 family protein [Flavobacteriaceae bacterium]
MKTIFYFGLFILFVYGCGSMDSKKMESENDVVEISNDSLDFKLLVFEPDFDSWLATKPPKGAYDLGYLEQKNRYYTREYNRRALIPQYGNLYPNTINYDPELDYGLELNYMLYMYYEFFQDKYNQRL